MAKTDTRSTGHRKTDGENGTMKKPIVLSLTDKELQDLYRVLIDRDAEGALYFLDEHVRKKVHQALEGG